MEKKKEPLPKLNEVQEAVLKILKHHGTNTQGLEFKQHQQALAIDRLYYELNEASIMLSEAQFHFIKVVPNY